jgi:hypothetical protein
VTCPRQARSSRSRTSSGLPLGTPRVVV